MWVVVIMVIFNSCYDEILIVPEYSENVFNVKLNNNQVDRILDSRGEQFYISPVPGLIYGGVPLQLDHMKIRGQSALNFQRKSYSVNLDDALILENQNDSTSYVYIDKFKLLSLVYDYTYIENRLSHLLLNEIGLWGLHTFYTQIVFNDDMHQGLYLFVEDPEDYLMKNENAEIVLRRYYRGEIAKIEHVNGLTSSDSEKYVNDFHEIYSMLSTYSGRELYDKLKGRMNIDSYMKKMAFDYIIKNGDLTDEIFFWAKKRNGSSYFDILPWDYDDIFSVVPHEIGRAWAVGTTFGERVYESHADVLDELNGRLIFSVEDDIDYIIATDDYLYSMYLIQLQSVLNLFTPNTIEQAFNKVDNELEFYYEIPEVINQSKFDASETSVERFRENIQEKRQFMLARIQAIKLKVNDSK